MVSFLSYGAIGLGLALAVLTFNLLRLEQKVQVPRIIILCAIYAFMGFSLIMSSIGFTAEYASNYKDVIKSLKTIAELSDTLDKMKMNTDKVQAILHKFEKMRHVLDVLTTVKGDKLSHWQKSQLDGVITSDMIKEIRYDLINLNAAMKKELAGID